MTTINETTINEINELIKSSYKSGKTRGSIEGYISFTYKIENTKAKLMVQDVIGKSDTSNSSWAETITYIRKNYGTISKKELINGMMATKGGTYASMNHTYNYIKFAIEYANQEVVAANLVDPKEAK